MTEEQKVDAKHPWSHDPQIASLPQLPDDYNTIKVKLRPGQRLEFNDAGTSVRIVSTS